MALNRKPSPEVRELKEQMELIQKQIAEAEANARAEENRLKAVVKHTGLNYALLINDLYDRLGIEPEHPTIRNSKNGPVEVSTDKSEEQRVQRLETFLSDVLDSADPELIKILQEQDAATRAQHRDERTKSSTSKTGSDSPSPDEDPIDDLPENDEEDQEEDVLLRAEAS